MSVTHYLTTEQVCGKLARAGIDEVTVGKAFSARLQPVKLDEPDKKYTLGVHKGDPQFPVEVYMVVFQFGLGRPLTRNSPLDEGGPDWRPRWISVEGPFPGRAPGEDAIAFMTRMGEISAGLTSAS